MTIDTSQAKRIIESLENQKIASSYLEYALQLPFGTVQRWKDGDVSSEEMILLKIIEVYPWIVVVADKQFDDKAANAAVVREASKIICSKLLE